ncbi:phosphotransferase [Sphaerisporangium sp. NPDC005288]|uniref:phosphotransferase n=1 Tax=Sphaerisporangium sp. NPDC005288 TaxID=3155114 RepID=UPI00339FE0F6
MGRTVSAWVTSGEEVLGLAGPFSMDIPWWAEVEQLLGHLRRMLEAEVAVLRLLRVEGGEGGRDGHAVYHAEALERPARLPAAERPVHVEAPESPERVQPSERPAGAEREWVPGVEARRRTGRDVTPVLASRSVAASRSGSGWESGSESGSGSRSESGWVREDLAAIAGNHELRAPWARAEGLREAFAWAADALARAGRPLNGPIRQRRTWNLAGLFRLPTDRGPVWLKTTPRFAADEAAVIAAFARHDPGLVPAVIAADRGRVLLDHVPGEDCWDAGEDVVTSAVARLVAAQAALAREALAREPRAGETRAGEDRAGDAAGPSRVAWDDRLVLDDRRGPVVAGLVRDLLAGDVGRELTAEEVSRALELVERWPLLAECGLPATIVHGDFHPGNLRGDGGPPRVLDFADAHFGDPVLDGLRIRDFLPRAARPAAARAWADAWASEVPGCDPARALALAEPLAHLVYAVRYQEFLDGIEPSERVYHLGDPAAVIRKALRLAAAPAADAPAAVAGSAGGCPVA